MAYEQLRRKILPNNTGVGAPYAATVDYFDTLTRKPFTLQFDSQVDDPQELTKGDEVFRYEYRPGKIRLVLYNGNGSVYTENVTGVSISKLAVKADTTTPYTTDGNDASVDLTGRLGLPPYQLTLSGTLGTPSAAYHQTATSRTESYPVRFYNLPQGQYVALVRDAQNNIAVLDLTVGAGPGVARGVQVMLQRTVLRTTVFQWCFNSLELKAFYTGARVSGVDILPTGTYVDGFLLPGSNGQTWRQVYSNGSGGVYFVDAPLIISSTLGTVLN